MKAIRFHSFGGPDVLQLEQVAIPHPGPREVLLRVHAAGTNPVDLKIRSGQFSRYHPDLPSIPGRDVSGVIEELGPGVTGWRAGQEVMGMLDYTRGAYAEYAVASVDEIIPKPPELDHIHAAAIPVAALTAWQALFEVGGVTKGTRVLIHGAGGGVGHFAVQFALLRGAEVIATVHPADLSMIQGFGVRHVIDYHAQRFETDVENVGVVLDTVGGQTRQLSWRVLREDGVLVSTVGHPCVPSQLGYDVEGREVVVKPNMEQLREIANLVASGQVKVLIAKTFPLTQAREAHERFEEVHHSGKTVLFAE